MTLAAHISIGRNLVGHRRWIEELRLDELKRQAGVKATGQRSTKAVYAYLLSWRLT